LKKRPQVAFNLGAKIEAGRTSNVGTGLVVFERRCSCTTRFLDGFNECLCSKCALGGGCARWYAVFVRGDFLNTAGEGAGTRSSNTVDTLEDMVDRG